MPNSSDRFAARLIRGAARRMREPAFWIIQAGVIAISLAHLAIEAGWIPLGAGGALPTAHHIPVILYLIPVAYAGLMYGWEGGVLTGLWVAALSSINVFLFSLEDFQWVLEIVFVILVIGMGVVMALPVERERVQRQRAEKMVQRLEALNELAHTAARTPVGATKLVLSELVSLLGLRDAGFVVWRGDKPDPVVLVTHLAVSDLPLQDRHRPGRPGSLTPSTGDGHALIESPVTAGALAGHLIVKSTPNTGDDPEMPSFLAAVGNQLAQRLENLLLQEQEQAMWSGYVKLVTEAQEEERRRLARDLHDGPAQHLAILVRSLEGDAEGGADGDKKLHESASAILGEVRRMARDQRPTLLDDLGIVPALEWLVNESGEDSEVTITLEVQGDLARLAPETEVALYRVAQEALRNAEHHAAASTIGLALRFEERQVELTITDDGRGFDVPLLPGGYVQEGRLGLMGMYERAQLVGGSLHIESNPGLGTVVSAKVGRNGLTDPGPSGQQP